MEYAPPAVAPPYLSVTQLDSLMEQGFLELELPQRLDRLYHDLSATANSDFFRLPLETKNLQYPKSQGTELGFYSIPKEKDYLTFRHSVHSSNLESTVTETWYHTAAFLHRIVYDVGRRLGIQDEAWQQVLDGTLNLPSKLDDSTPTLLRLFKYLPNDGTAEKHTDLGLVTLCVGNGKGLQVFRRDTNTSEGGWVDVKGPTVLIGRTLRILSSGRTSAGLHRVVGNPDGRSSAVFALRANTKKRIELVPFSGWGSVDGQELWQLVRDGSLNVNATPDIRERQRLDRRKRLEAQPVGHG